MSEALPVPDYRDPGLVVADAEIGNVAPEHRGRGEWAQCCGCCWHRAPAGLCGRQRWPCERGNCPRPDEGGCAVRAT